MGMRLHMAAKEEKCPLSHAQGNRSDSHILLKLHNACCCTTFNVRLRATTSPAMGKSPEGQLLSYTNLLHAELQYSLLD